MIDTPLQVRRRRDSEQTPRALALLVQGHDAQLLVRALRVHRLEASKLQLYCLPAGYLLVLPTAIESTIQTPGILLLQRRGRGILIPTDAELWPPIQDGECDALTLGDLLLLHPSWGTYRIHESDSISFAALFALPQVRNQVDWSIANPGPSLPPLLSSVRTELPPPDRLFDEEDKEGIGDRPPPKRVTKELKRAKRRAAAKQGSPNKEKSPKQARSKGPVRSLLAWMYLKLYERLPSGAKQVTIWDRIASWAGQQFRSNSKIAGSAYFDWFMKELQEDPDSALRHAIPLRDDARKGSGLAEEFMDLPNRDPLFLMSDLDSSGAAASTLYVSYEDHRTLIQRYRELAQRELEHGRPRRAAYILGTLLGDLDGAASMLLDGGYYREAAAIYEKLRMPERAAHALARGGYLEDAIEIYEREELYEAAGELYRKLGLPKQERRAYRRAAKKLEREGAFERSAEIHERRLGNPSGALEVLSTGYRHASSSLSERSAMLKKWLEIARRNDRRDEALQWLRGWPESELRPELHAAAAIAFAAIARRDDDPELCRLAADRVRSTVASVLSSPLGTAERNQALDALSSLGNEDRALRRDVEEVRASLTQSTREQAPRSSARGLSTISSVTIQDSMLLAHSRGHDELLFLVQDSGSEAHEDRSTRLLSFYQGGIHEEASWRGSEALRNSGHVFLVAEDRASGAVEMFSTDPQSELPPKRRRRNGVRVGMTSNRGSHLLTVARSWPPCVLEGRYDTSPDFPEPFALVEDIYLGGLSSTQAIRVAAEPPIWVNADALCCHVRGRTYISAPNGVFLINEKGKVIRSIWHDIPFAMIALGSEETSCMIASFADGLRQHFSRRKKGDGHLLPFGTGLHYAHLAALTHELLIAVDRDQAQLYQVEGSSITLIRQAQLDISEPILGVEAGFGINDFVLLLGDSEHVEASSKRIHVRHCSWT